MKQIVASEGLTVHPDKQQVMRRHRQQHVTGIVVNDKLSLDRDTMRRFRAVLHQAERHGPQGLQWNGNSDVIGALRGYANFIAMTDAARGAPYVERVRALAAKHGGGKAAAPAVPQTPSQRSLPAGQFRKRSAAGQAPWPAWWQPAQAAAPVLEKTAEQIAEEKKAQRDAARAQAAAGAAAPQAAARPAQTQAPSAPSTPAAAPAPGALSRIGWIVSMMFQALYVVTTFLAGSSPLIWLLTGGVFISNFLRRKSGWGGFLAAVFVSSAVATLVHSMRK
ncbi:hypothetical protein WIX39_020390 [Variovorax sp. AB1(2024)]|uniref:hypothetical protein n=1 Tax=Variovorax sp. AB1(2024) TaxID=3132214 RepID=UPI0030975254